MLGTLSKILPESQAVALVRMGAPVSATVEGRPWRRFPSEVLRDLRGLGKSSGSIDVLIPEAAALELGSGGGEAVVFLQRQGDGYRPVRHSEPLEVPDPGRDEFLAGIAGWLEATAPGAGPAAQRAQVIRMLRAESRFLREDASRAALDLDAFGEGEVESLIAVAEGDDRHPGATGLVRDNVLSVIFRDGPEERLAELGRELLPRGEHRQIYLGLAERDPGEAGAIAKAFLDDPKEKVQIGGVLVAGLLRRADLIDAFEKNVRGAPSPALRDALAQGRAYVKREL